MIYILKGIGVMLSMFALAFVVAVPIILVMNKALPIFDGDHWFMKTTRLLGYIFAAIVALAIFYIAGGGPPLA